MWKAKNIPFLVLLLVSLYPLFEHFRPKEKSPEVEWADSLLPAAARDVLLLTADFSAYTQGVFDPEGLSIVADIDSSLARLQGLRRSSSLLSASVIKAEQDEILVVPFIREQILDSYSPTEIEQLKAQYTDYPEIRPYLSPDFKSCVFYLEPGLTYPSHKLIQQVEDLQSRIRSQYGVALEFSGLRALRVYSERYLTQDMLKIVPLLFLIISLLYFFAFRSWRLLILAWSLKILVTTFAYGCFRLFGGQLSPLVVLVPIFNFGLLSDYFVHMYYHLRGSSGLHDRAEAQAYLAVPLSLTAFTSVIGFLSLTVLGGEGHFLLATTVSISILTVYGLVQWWIPGIGWIGNPESSRKVPSNRRGTRRLNRALAIVFLFIWRIRYGVLAVCLAAVVLGCIALMRLEVQPYPLEQFPPSSTIMKAESVLNEKFSGTVPFTLEIDSAQAESFINRRGLQRLEEVHSILTADPDIGYQNSILTVLKRMHYYFNESDPRYLAIPQIEEEQRFSALVEQYQLFYSASASPESYESLIDSAHRIVAIQGILKYRGITSIREFESTLSEVETLLPAEWRIRLSGPLDELLQNQKRLERNWVLAFTLGSVLIFITVLVFFKSLKMSLISLLPSLFILLVVTGISPVLGIQINEYTIIIVAVGTGLTIDYTIHMLNSIRAVNNRSGCVVVGRGTDQRTVMLRYGYALIRHGGLPVFLSFLTSLVAFSSLYLSSFRGAAHFGLLISVAIGSAFFIGVFLLPLFFVPGGKGSTERSP